MHATFNLDHNLIGDVAPAVMGGIDAIDKELQDLVPAKLNVLQKLLYKSQLYSSKEAELKD